MDSVRLRAMELGSAAICADEPQKRVWIQLAKVGQFAGHPAGPFELSEATFEEAVRNFRTTSNRRVPIDFEHASEADPTEGSIPTHGAPAQGWIYELDNRKHDGLWGLVEWGTKASEYIRGGQYHFISPAFRFGSRDRVTGQSIGARLTSAGLTNQPFLDGMAQLAATDRHEEPMPIDDVTLKDLATKAATLEVQLSDAKVKTSTLELQLKDATSKAEAAETELVTLRAWKEAREQTDFQNEVNDAFDTYKDVKKLADSDKEAMLVVLKASPDAFRRLYPKVKPADQVLLRQVVPQTGRTLTDGLPVEQRTHKATTDINALQKKYMSEGHNLEEALKLAYREVTTTVGRA